MTTRSLFLASLACFLAPAVAPLAARPTLYVAPGGSDVNPGTEGQPFATVEKARQAVRALNQQMGGDIVVVLRGGTYRIDRTLVFEPEDSGGNGHNVIYRAQAGETPILSGGKPVTGWQVDEKGRWKATAPVENFRQLYVNGARAARARGAPPAGIKLVGNEGYTTTAVEMAGWKNPADLEFCYIVVWTHTRCKVASIRREGNQAVVTMLQPYFKHARTKNGVQVDTPNYVENALELLDEPGEWYLDRPAKTVYYMPEPGEDMTKVEVVAPAVEKLVELRGTLDRPVHNLHFVGIAFEHGNWLRPSKIGHCEVQSNFIVDSDRKDSFTRSDGFENLHNENLKSPANVVCHASKSVRFERCTFTRLGGAGLDIESGSQDNVVLGCRFYDISGTGVQIGDVLKDDHHPDDPRKIVKNNSVENCYLHDCCVDYRGGQGICVGYTEATRIAHNEICRIPHSGISVGWGWGEEDSGGGGYHQPFVYQTPTPAKNNCIEMNHVHHVVYSMNDAGGIYTLGNMPGTIIRGNHIHDNGHGRQDGGQVDKIYIDARGRYTDPASHVSHTRGYMGGIYLDEGSARIEIANNLVYHVFKPMFYNNLVQNRKTTCKEHDNFFGSRPDEAKPIAERAGLEAEYRDLLKASPLP
jgi:hypothetical protein